MFFKQRATPQISERVPLLVWINLAFVSRSYPRGELMTSKACVFSVYVALGLRLNSPFKRAVDLKLEAMKEGGLVREKKKLLR